MKIESSQVMDKIVNMEGSPMLLSGYIYRERDAKAKTFRLYPALRSSRYFEVNLSSVVELIESSRGGERVTVALQESAEVYLVDRKRFLAPELNRLTKGRDLTPLKGKLPPYADRLTLYLLLANKEILEAYLGTESIPGTGQTGSPMDDL